MSVTIGIDLGTTNSCAVYNDGAKEIIIEAASGRNTIPSVVAVNPDGSFVVGAAAQRRLIRSKRDEAKFVFSNIKRRMGIAYVDGQSYGAQLDKDGEGRLIFVGPERLHTPEELSAEILKSLKAAAERRIGKKVTGAMITVPALFNQNQRDATLDAGKLAGFKLVELMTEPEAAAVAYGLDKGDYAKTVVFDMGGGTLDVVLMETGAGRFKTLGKNGSSELGGINFDRRIQDYVIEKFRDNNGIDLSEKPMSMLKLAPVAEGTKIELTEALSAPIIVEDGALDMDGSGRFIDVNYDITRPQFEQMVEDLIERAMVITRQVMSDADVHPKQVKEVVLVGGMTRVPAVRAAVADFFGEAKLQDSISVDTAIAKGAAIKGAEIDGNMGQRFSHDQITGAAFGIAIEHDRFVQIIPKGAAFGTLETVEITTAQDDQAVIPIAIAEGQSRKASENALIKCVEHKIEPRKATVATVQLTLLIDENGQVIAEGRDMDTGEQFEIIGAR